MPRGRPSVITESFVRAIFERLNQKKPVRRALPMWGRVHVDRHLPFLFVYRRPLRRVDPGTERLLLGEAAYILTHGGREDFQGLSRLIERFAERSVSEFGAFLLVEVWAGHSTESKGSVETLSRPAFRVVHRGASRLSPTVGAFEEALRTVRVRKLASEVESAVDTEFHPPSLRVLLSDTLLGRKGVFTLGLEVRPIYRDPDGTLFPLVLRELHREVSQSLKQGLVRFVRTRTSDNPSHYQTLGRRAIVKAVWEVDRILAEVGNEFDFLLSVTPVNSRKAWTVFERKGCSEPPRFRYRPLPLAPTLLKRKLFSAPIERIEDPELGWIFRAKQYELDRQLTALLDRDSQRFLYASLQIYGGVDPELTATAAQFLDKIPAGSRERRGSRKVNAETFAARAREEIESFRDRFPEITARVEVTDEVTGLMVSRGNLLVGSDLSIPSSRLEALIQHEVGTHVLTHFNGKSQPFRLLQAGLAGYDELQEGLAVLSEYLVDGLSRPRLRLLAARVLAVKSMIDGATFVDTFKLLDRNYEFSRETAFSVTLRVFRGGGLTKDASYLRGLLRVVSYLRSGGEFEPLLAGKIGADDVPVISELLRRKVLRQPPLQPRYLNDPAAMGRLEAVRANGSLLDLFMKRGDR